MAFQYISGLVLETDKADVDEAMLPMLQSETLSNRDKNVAHYV